MPIGEAAATRIPESRCDRPDRVTKGPGRPHAAMRQRRSRVTTKIAEQIRKHKTARSCGIWCFFTTRAAQTECKSCYSDYLTRQRTASGETNDDDEHFSRVGHDIQIPCAGS